MTKNKKIKFVNYIVINGERIPLNNLSDEERKQVANQLNNMAMTAIGYIRIEKTA